MISPERIAWVAGLVEGEGWFGVRGDARPVLQVISTDEDVVLRLRDWTGVGTVSMRPLRPGRKQAWRWDVGRRDEAGALMELLLPFLLERRRRCRKCGTRRQREHRARRNGGTKAVVKIAAL